MTIKTTNDNMVGFLRDIQRRLTFLERMPSRPPPGGALRSAPPDLVAQIADLQARVTELESRAQ